MGRESVINIKLYIRFINTTQMINNTLLFSMPGGGELIFILIVILVLLVSPVLAIVYYSQAKRLGRENKELMEKLLDKK